MATRLVVDRERERIKFRVASYWDLEGTFDAGAGREPRMFPARLHSIDQVRVASGSDFGSDGELSGKKERVHLDRSKAEALVEALHDTSYDVRSVEAKPYKRSPYAPFRTTTLQQEASRKLGMSASVTMSVAQRLYENGFITYMRTDSTTLSSAAVQAARSQVRELYGPEYLPDSPRVYASKVKNAQEAHEAIRPSGDSFRTPGQTGLTGEQFRLYELIWMRTVASQMKDAVGQSVSVRLGGHASDGRDVVFAASGRVITFHGFLKAYVEGTDAGKRSDDDQVPLPELAEGDRVSAASLTASGHETKPPARYTEATLIKELEDREIGRPSTYASIMGTIINRGYVYKKGTALVPAWIAFSVVRLLEEHFTRQIDYEFTARMEDVLDEIAAGRDRPQLRAQRVLLRQRQGRRPAPAGQRARRHRRQGAGDLPGRRPRQRHRAARRSLRPLPRGSRRGGQPHGQACQRARRPAARRADPGEGEGAVRQPGRRGDPARQAPRVGASGGGQERALRSVRHRGAARGREEVAMPRTGSLFKSMTLDTISLDDAVKLLSLPRVVGTDADGVEITAQNGRYGPYLKKGTDSRTIASEEQLLSITLDEALAIYAQPKQRGRGAATAPLKELGNDPVSGAAGRGEGRPLRRVRHRRRVQRHPPQGRHRRGDHARTRRRAAGRAACQGPRDEEDRPRRPASDRPRRPGRRRPPPRSASSLVEEVALATVTRPRGWPTFVSPGFETRHSSLASSIRVDAPQPGEPSPRPRRLGRGATPTRRRWR